MTCLLRRDFLSELAIKLIFLIAYFFYKIETFFVVKEPNIISPSLGYRSTTFSVIGYYFFLHVFSFLS